MADLLSGTFVKANDTPITVSASDNTDVSTTSTSFVQGTPVVGVAFTAATTGRALVLWHARLDGNTSGFAHCSVVVRTGATVGSGTVVSAADVENSVESGNTSTGASRNQATAHRLITGLTPGSAYNATLEHRIEGSGTANVYSRRVTVLGVS